ncbi:SDR family oxidoreductase [Moritella viscosa]|uniref:Lipoprotein n=1 Tax=Moritella viscosa TaxID=80854 RepID=A0ABY1H9B7_9GAMM|nr:SDR family oxidoreductase [Moritella viscosa]SGY86431.1 Putative uncharacterized protein [Moritella viscosa]SGY90113.1 Putative uncharacterized protein [Moritella viscosa]SHO24958.1 Putative uncharacterized protein [Moritella viscosa]
MQRFVSIAVLVGLLLTGCNSSDENSSDENSSSDSYIVPTKFGPTVAGLFDRYTWIKAPNGKAIHIFSQPKVSVAQLLKARNTLEFFLTNTVSTNKKLITNSMADRGATLFIFDDEEAMEIALSNEAFVEDAIAKNPQALYATEIFVEGDSNYLADSPAGRDATFEEVLHFTQAQGIAPVMKDFRKRIAEQADRAIEANVWNPTEVQLEEWKEEGDEVTGYTTSHEYFAAIVEAYYGMWENGTKGMDGYIGYSRVLQAENDKEGLKIVTSFLPKFIPTTMDIDPSFAADSTFHMSYDAGLAYTTKSQYLMSVRLTGTNNSNVSGNAQDNLLMGNEGDNKIDGKGGINTYKVNGLRVEFIVTPHGGAYLVQDKDNARNGADTLSNIKYIQFNDEKIDLSKL